MFGGSGDWITSGAAVGPGSPRFSPVLPGIVSIQDGVMIVVLLTGPCVPGFELSRMCISEAVFSNVKYFCRKIK